MERIDSRPPEEGSRWPPYDPSCSDGIVLSVLPGADRGLGLGFSIGPVGGRQGEQYDTCQQEGYSGEHASFERRRILFHGGVGLNGVEKLPLSEHRIFAKICNL